MQLNTLEIPDDVTGKALWLERQLVGSDLGALVAELAAWQAIAPEDIKRSVSPPLDDLLGSQKQTVLSDGLIDLNGGQIATLLAFPSLLLDLQELVLIYGGNYWKRRLTLSAEEIATMDRVLSKLQVRESLVGVLTPRTIELNSDETNINIAGVSRSATWYPMALAASLLVALGLGALLYNAAREKGNLAAELKKSNTDSASKVGVLGGKPGSQSPSDSLSREMQKQIADVILELSAHQKVSLAESVAEYEPAVFIGITDETFVMVALRRLNDPLGELRRETKVAIADSNVTATLRLLRDGAQTCPKSREVLLLEECWVQIQIGRLDEADQVLKELEALNHTHPIALAQISNARGAWMLHSGIRLDGTEAVALFDSSEQSLRSAASNEPLAWLNLIELFRVRGDQSKLASAAREYAKVTEHRAVKDFIARRFAVERP